jgi:hypothetical protein
MQLHEALQISQSRLRVRLFNGSLGIRNKNHSTGGHQQKFANQSTIITSSWDKVLKIIHCLQKNAYQVSVVKVLGYKPEGRGFETQ